MCMTKIIQLMKAEVDRIPERKYSKKYIKESVEKYLLLAKGHLVSKKKYLRTLEYNKALNKKLKELGKECSLFKSSLKQLNIKAGFKVDQ